MVSLHVFIGAAVANSPQQEADLAQRLISDLKRAGATVVIDDGTIPDTQFLAFLERELPRCHWLILLKTAEATRSLRVQATIYNAQQLLNKQEIQGILQIVCPSTETEEKSLVWPETQTISFLGDYPRVRDRVLLELDLLQVDDLISKDVSKISTSRLGPIESMSPSPMPLIPAQSAPLSPPVAGDLTSAIVRKSTYRFSLPDISSLLKTFIKRETPVSSPMVSQSLLEDRPVALPPRSRRNRRWALLAAGITLVLVTLIGAYLFVFGLPFRPGATTPGTSRVSTAKSSPTSQVLASDTFHRANQFHWGKASDGQLWGGDANDNRAFSINDNAGQIANLAGPYQTTLGPAAADVDVTLSGTVNAFVGNSDLVNLGIILRSQDANHWYKALIDGSNLSIFKSVQANRFSQLKKTAFVAQGGTSYTLRFRAIGSTLSAKVWPSNQAEPAQWMLTTQDTTFPSGQAGVRVVLQDTTQIHITAFQEVKASA